MKLENLIEDVNEFFGCDIREQSRKKEIITARKIYFITARELGYTLSTIGLEVERSHSMVWHSIRAHNDNMLYDKYYRDCYNTFHEHYYNKKNEVVSETQIKGFDALLELNEDELLEFKETRLKPFLSMLKSRNKQKQLINK